MENIGIFQGKQKTNNIHVLNLLFEKGPLSTWNIAKQLKGEKEVHCMNAIILKRMKHLQKLEYVNFESKKWILRIKGTVAVILSQPQVKMWNPVWNKILESKVNQIKKLYAEKNPRVVIGDESFSIADTLDESVICPRTFENWVNFANIVKKLMEEGIINLDKISENRLLKQINIEALDNQEFNDLINPSK